MISAMNERRRNDDWLVMAFEVESSNAQYAEITDAVESELEPQAAEDEHDT